MSPLRYYLLILALNVGVSGMVQVLTHPESPGGGDGFLDSSFVALQIGLASMLLLLPVAVGLRLTHEDQRLYVIEHYAFILYAAAQAVLVVLATQVSVALFGRQLLDDVDGILWVVALTAFLVQGGREFYRERWWVVLGKVVASYAFAVASVGVGAMLLSVLGVVS